MRLATLFSFFLALAFLAPPEAHAQTYAFEAEDATLSDSDPDDADPGAEVRDASTDTNVSGTFTGTGFVALQKGVITVDISSVPAGEYDLSVNYASPFGLKYEYVDVDGVRYGDSAECTESFTFADTAVWTPLALADATTGTVTVDGTTGTLVITACYGYTYFDSVTLTAPGSGGMTIAEARAAGVDAEVTVSGTVTRAAGAFSYFQDETGGLAIRQTSGAFFDDIASGTITPGTVIEVTGTISQFPSDPRGGILQLNGPDLTSYTVVSQGDAPDAQEVTLQELIDNGEQYESELVQVSGLTTASTGTFAAGTSYEVTDVSATLTDGLRIPNADDTAIDGTDIPSGAFTATGIVGQFTPSSNPDPAAGYQVLVIASGDVEADTPPVGGFTFEAEDGAVSDPLPDDTEPGAEVRDATTDTNVPADYTGTGFVALQKGALTIDISGLEPGEYNLSVRYAAPFGDTKYEYVDVDGVRYGDSAECTESFAFPEATAWTNLALTDASSGTVTVDGSTGTLVITACYGYTYYDSVTLTPLVAPGTETPAASGGIALGRAAPNPFGTSARIPFSLEQAETVRLTVYDVLGREVAVLANGPMASGDHEAVLSGASLRSGVYIVRLTAGDASVVTRVTLQK
ncbi:T9SS type A sorting domain-containing protein [Rubricoccus marinus]|uniref:Secretion system C-terminal sorting domain-containing protein n=1 Tax=Rubricoccus marinus TaxID=716817 RepID=A0A259TUE0_9BACT|nr:T9SS type A sorting domain-containing protein [Rubricoccus marinus]OZC01320.1 hypothetical protein BSZ36_17905 [Rubricoccus marinus]